MERARPELALNAHARSFEEVSGHCCVHQSFILSRN